MTASVRGTATTGAARPPLPMGAGQVSRWADALTAARLVAIDPAGLGGAALRAPPGPARDRWVDGLKRALAPAAPVRRLPAAIQDDRLLGGVDLIASLHAGRPVLQPGVLTAAHGGIVVIAMAERLGVDVAARIATVLDRGEVAVEREGLAERSAARFGIVAFDEGSSPDEHVPARLLDRLAFHIDLRDITAREAGLRDDAQDELPAIGDLPAAAARARLAAVDPAPDAIIQAMVSTAASLGIVSVMAPLLALRAARAAAALAGRLCIGPEDAMLAARLVLAPRARLAPAADDPAEDDPAADAGPADDGPADAGPADERAAEGGTPGDSGTPPVDPAAGSPGVELATSDRPAAMPSLDEIVLAAAQAMLPDGLLAALKSGARVRRPASPGVGSGRLMAAPRRGRPAGVRAATLRPGARLALVETLRAAAPWQPVRRAETRDRAQPRLVEVRREDFRIRTFVQRRESTILFCVDASGSAAFHRLAETKGAVELLLSEAYVARTHAALIVFRGTRADLLLPPTRSLSRARSLLATLPGGGGTPIAAGIEAAVLTALGERRRGRDPLVVLLSDGRANIGLDGVAARPRATEDALAAARQLGAQQIAAVVVDTSPRPRGEAAALAAAMGARYVALPYVEAAAVRDVVRVAR